MLSLKTPEHEQHYGKMAELILKTESAGILNWLLEGRTKLAKDKLQLTQTPEQKARSVNLLLASDSPAAFVRSCLVKKKDASWVWLTCMSIIRNGAGRTTSGHLHLGLSTQRPKRR